MIENLGTIIASVVGVATTITGIITTVLTKIKVAKLKNADTLYERMLADMIEAEQTYASFKQKGIDASGFKKSYVMNDLRTYALSNDMTFDTDTWSEQVEKMIEFSDKVNAHN